MDPREYQRLAERTECDQRMAGLRRYMADKESSSPYWSTRIEHAVLGLCGEAGELAAIIERWLYYGQPFDKLNLAEELGDCLWYIAEACNTLDLKLDEIMQANINKLRRRYPDKFKSELAVEEARNREAEMQEVAAVVEDKPKAKRKRKRTTPQGVYTEVPVEAKPITEQGRPKCDKCDTPFSDRKPKYCPECGEAT